MSISCPSRLGTWSEELWDRPDFMADSNPSPRSCGVPQLSWPTPSRILPYTGSTIYPGPCGPSSELTRGRSAVPDNMV